MEQYDLGAIAVHKRARLPHWSARHAVYFVTWHLADALPAEVLIRLRVERDRERSRIEKLRGAMTGAESATIERVYVDALEEWLDSSAGACVLGDSRCASIVRDALLHFDGVRYQLHAWCVMPNHVHVVFSSVPDFSVSTVLHSWKSFTSKEIHRLLGTSGTPWQAESYDRCIRNPAELEQKIRYVLNNPSKAELFDWPFSAAYPARTP
jgi:REP element-mobilizing transposase RayT